MSISPESARGATVTTKVVRPHPSIAYMNAIQRSRSWQRGPAVISPPPAERHITCHHSVQRANRATTSSSSSLISGPPPLPYHQPTCRRTSPPPTTVERITHQARTTTPTLQSIGSRSVIPHLSHPRAYTSIDGLVHTYQTPRISSSYALQRHPSVVVRSSVPTSTVCYSPCTYYSPVSHSPPEIRYGIMSAR